MERLHAGREVAVPSDALDPPLKGGDVLQGTITKVTRGSRYYPSGRLEVLFQDASRHMFPVDTFSASWLLPTTASPPPPSSPFPATVTRRTPRKPAPAAPAPSPPEGALLPGPHVSPPHANGGGAGGRPGSASPSGRQRRRSSGGGGPATPRLQSAIKRAALLRTPSGKRVTFAGPAPMAVTRVPRISTAMNALNALILVAVAVPAVWLGYAVCHVAAPPAALPTPLQLPSAAELTSPAWWASLGNHLPSATELTSPAWWISLGYHQPLAFVNAVFLANVDVLFWLVAQVQGTTWLIDPWWTLIPPLIQLFYQFHPLAVSNVVRGMVAAMLVRVWAVRLTWSYLRREEFQLGAREDWRYADLAAKYGRAWPVLSLVATYLVQHAMLVGITLPLYAVYTSRAPWSGLDTLATVMAVTGLAIAAAADDSLRAFMRDNERRLEAGLPPVLLLDKGVWRYSRRPNYFGEQLFWWGVALFAVRLGSPWMVCGTAFNSLCLVAVTRMTEARMLSRPERAELYREYMRTTSAWVPLPKWK